MQTKSIHFKIHPSYGYLRAFVESIPHIFEREGVEIYKQRNLVKVLTAPDGTLLNVKRFHVPHGPNRLVYSWNIRKPKGRRAFEYAEILTDKGIDTPQPVALIEERHALGLLGFSYLVTLQCDYGHTLYEVGQGCPGEYDLLAKALARFAAYIHQHDVLHKDFTPGNVLWKQDAGGFHFMLVDINRMNFGAVSVRAGLRNICRFWGPKDFSTILAREYARVRRVDEDEAVAYLLKERRRYWARFGRRHEIPFRLES